jgi:hypothetical protein
VRVWREIAAYPAGDSWNLDSPKIRL